LDNKFGEDCLFEEVPGLKTDRTMGTEGMTSGHRTTDYGLRTTERSDW